MAAQKPVSDLVTERRLRPVYDFLDIGNNKRALSETEKLLKKQPDFLAAKALKTLSLIRLGRMDEAKRLLKEITDKSPEEPFTLQALTYCYGDLGEPESVITLYERVVKSQSKNEEHLSHLAMAYARVGDYRKLCLTAMQLYKVKPAKSFYYCWAVMCNVIQAYTDPELAQTMYLPLAEKMTRKYLAENTILVEEGLVSSQKSQRVSSVASQKLCDDTDREVMLFAMVLKLRGATGDSLSLIQRELSKGTFVKFLVDAEMEMIELMVEHKIFHDIFDICKLFLERKPDDCMLWEQCFNAVEGILKADPSLVGQYTEEVCRMIEKSIASSEGQHAPIRGPLLARFSFLGAVSEKEVFANATLPAYWDAASLLLEYVKTFGSRKCCYNDIASYLWLVKEDEQKKFFEKLKELCGGLPITSILDGDAETNYAENADQLQMHVCALRISSAMRRQLCSSLSVEQRFKFCLQCVSRYRAGLQLGSSLAPAELQPSDSYMGLGFWALWEIFAVDGAPSRVWTMAALLEEATNNSPSNFVFRILLAKCYALLGAADCALVLTEEMGVKYIIRDSLWYITYDQLSPFGLFEDLLQWTTGSSMFYIQTKKEVVDCVIQCFKSAAFLKILEMFELNQKLDNSFQGAASLITLSYMYLITECENVEHIEGLLQRVTVREHLKRTFNWEAISFNMDFDVVPFEGIAELSVSLDHVTKCTTQELIDQLIFQDFIFKIFYKLCCAGVQTSEAADAESAAAVSNGQKEDEKPRITLSSLDEAARLLDELAKHFRSCQEKPVLSSDAYAIAALPRAYFNMYLSATYFDVLECVFAMCILTMRKAVEEEREKDMVKEKGQERDSAASNVEDVWMSLEKLQLLLRNMFACHHLQHWFSLFPEKQLIHISYLLQTFSVVLLMCEVTFHTLQKPAPPKTRKFRRKKGQQQHHAQLVSGNDPEEQSEKLVLLNEFQKFCAVLVQANETCCGLIADLNLLMDTDENLLKFEHSVLTLEEFEKLARYKVTASYRKSLKELMCLYNHNDTVASALKKKFIQ